MNLDLPFCLSIGDPDLPSIRHACKNPLEGGHLSDHVPKPLEGKMEHGIDRQSVAASAVAQASNWTVGGGEPESEALDLPFDLPPGPCVRSTALWSAERMRQRDRSEFPSRGRWISLVIA